VLGGGLVNDTLTGLVWQQQASAATMTWAAAKTTYCPSAGSGFRLPTIKELDSLVDLTVTSGAAINQTAFPRTPAEPFWSSTADLGGASAAWYVDFSISASSLTDSVGSYYRVRCVR
jgi:hypothetical protein